MAERSLNPRFSLRPRPRLTPSLENLEKGILNGDRLVLSQAITLIESRLPEHQALARELVEACLPDSGRAIRLGITGSPGVGKSTFIESLTLELLELGKRVAILAVDPSSSLTKGSILGDKTRMEKLMGREDVYIRPSPAGGSLGGVARHTRETLLLCEAAGYEVVLIETVGVGQSETAVRYLVDLFLLLLLPGAGDELQGIKRGIVEMADLLVVNKAEGERMPLAQATVRAYRNAMHLYPPKSSGWAPEVVPCSALEAKGMGKIWSLVEKFRKHTQENGFWVQQRKQQAVHWLEESIREQLYGLFYGHPAVKEQLSHVEQEVLNGRMSSFAGADYLMNLFLNKK